MMIGTSFAKTFWPLRFRSLPLVDFIRTGRVDLQRGAMPRSLFIPRTLLHYLQMP